MKIFILCLLLFILPAAVLGQGVEASRVRKTTFSNLGTPSNSNIRDCTDCGIAVDGTCTSGGTGATATRRNSAWYCSTGGVAGASGITIGTTPITSGTANRVLFHSAAGDVVSEDGDFTFLTDTLTVTKQVIGGGGVLTSSGAGGALGTAAFQNTGTSGANLPFLNGANTWSAANVFNLNTASAPTPATGAGLQVVGTDATVARAEVDAFGAIGAFTVRRADGTGASPTALQSGDQIGAFNFHGYYVTGGPAYSGVQASVQGFATQNWTSTANGTKLVFNTTPNSSTTIGAALTLDQDKSATFGGAMTLAGTVSGGGNQINNVIIGTVTPLAGFHTTLSATGTFTGVDAVFAPANTTGNGVAFNNSVLTTGNTVSITASGTAAASNTKTALNVATSGANATSSMTTFGASVANTSTGTTSTNIGGQFSASGGSTNVGLKVTGGQVYSTVNGALSTGDGSALKLDGTWITGGSATTTKPFVLIEPSGTSSTSWSTSGTGIGVNGTNSAMNLIDLQTNGAAVFRFRGDGLLTLSSGANFNWAGDTNFSRNNTGVLQVGTTTTNALGSIMAVNFTSTGTFATSSTTDATTTTSGALQIAGGAAIRKRVFIDGITTSSGVQTAVLCQSSGGEMIADSVACLASSSRFKNRILPLSSGLDEIMALHPVSYHYRPEGIFAKNTSFQRERIGLIAEDVAKIDPRLVGYEADGITPRSVGYEQIVPILINGMKEQQAQIEALKTELKQIKAASLKYHGYLTY